MDLLIAQAVAQKSYLAWMYESLGLFYSLVLPLVGIAVFVGACLVVAQSRRPSVIAAYLVFVPLPLLIGIFGSIEGAIASFLIVASSVSAPSPAEVAAGWSAALLTAYVGFLLMFPSYLVVSIGLFVRARE